MSVGLGNRQTRNRNGMSCQLHGRISFLTNNKIQARMSDLEKTFRRILGRMMNKTITTEGQKPTKG
jgi:hypothetical protein